MGRVPFLTQAGYGFADNNGHLGFRFLLLHFSDNLVYNVGDDSWI